ncbi:MAG: biotin--[acetyl-CoA-carboxylase] ligase [Pseudomonadota bacterium]
MSWHLADGTAVLCLSETESTNAEAVRRASMGLLGPLWILAERQTRGRARRGRSWSSLDGNLFASLLIRPAMTPDQAALVSFAACLSVADLVDAVLGPAAATLKWPNDVLARGRKISGILLESSASHGSLDWLVIGIGVNLIAKPEAGALRQGGTPATSLAEEGGAALSPIEALETLSASLTHWLALLAREGFGPVRAAWLSRASHLGCTIGAGLPTERLEGIFEDVDATGSLVLRTPDDQRRVIPAADVYFPD